MPFKLIASLKHLYHRLAFDHKKYIWQVDNTHRILLSYETSQYASGSYDPYEPDIWPLYCKIRKENTVVYDIGTSSIGIFSLVAALDGASRVVAFEAHPDNALKLCRNVRLNGFQNTVKVISKAVFDSEGVTTLYVVGNTEGLHTLATGIYSDRPLTEIQIFTTTLDSFVQQSGEPSPNIVKIDVEGSEIRVLLGMQQILSGECPPIVIVELHPEAIKSMGNDINEINVIAAKVGLQVYRPDGQILASLYNEASKHIILSSAWPLNFHI
ncbi:MAG: FkbM family methyltransferase [Aggregatilineales bacterium]